MRLVVRQNERTINEYRFAGGPIHIGRHVNNQIILPEVRVSRQHAVLTQNPEGNWIVEDLHSANRTYLNEVAVEKEQIKTGDVIQIASFFIDVDTEQDIPAEEPIHLDDTIVTDNTQPQIVIRTLANGNSPDVRLPASRIKDFVKATEEVCQANGLEKLLHVLLATVLEQFSARRVWCAMRNDAIGPMVCNAGFDADGEQVGLSDISLHKKIDEAIASGDFMLFRRVAPNSREREIRSAMIAPVIAANGCFGAIYIDNDLDQDPYTPADLDYLLLLMVHTAAIVENF